MKTGVELAEHFLLHFLYKVLYQTKEIFTSELGTLTVKAAKSISGWIHSLPLNSLCLILVCCAVHWKKAYSIWRRKAS